MLRKIVATLIISLVSISVSAQVQKEVTRDNITEMTRPASFDEDYYVGLKAYEDGFVNVAKLSFESFLLKTSKSKESDFARYILYQIYLKEGNLKKAESTLAMIDNKSDERFNEEKIVSDRMSILVKTDCTAAKRFLIDDTKADFATYLKSECPVDKELLLHVAKTDYPVNEVLFLLNKMKDNKTLMMFLYTEYLPNKKKLEVLSYYGKYFALNKMSTEFYQIYNAYKDKDLTEAALDMAWSTGSLDTYMNLYNKDVKKEYKLQPATYCRMIDASNKSNKKYDCDIIDGCMQDSKLELNKTKVSCLIKQEDKNKLNVFMSYISAKEATDLCEFARYIMNKKLYNNNFIYRFNSCADKPLLYEELVKHKDADAIITLAGIAKDQHDYAYLAYAYHLKKNSKEMEKNLAKVTDKNLLDVVNKLIGK